MLICVQSWVGNVIIDLFFYGFGTSDTMEYKFVLLCPPLPSHQLSPGLTFTSAAHYAR